MLEEACKACFMKYIFYFVIASVFLIIFALSARKKSHEETRRINTYRYSLLLKIFLVLGTIILIVLIAFTIPPDLKQISNELNWQVIGGGILIFILNPLICFYFIYTKIFLLDDKIIKITPFNKKSIEYKDVKKIVLYHSSGNPGAAMARIYSDKKITFEAFIDGFDELISEVMDKCTNAVVIEKQK